MEQYSQPLFTFPYPEQQNQFSAPPSRICSSRSTPIPHVLQSLPKGTAILEPTKTASQYLSGHTSPDMCGYFNPKCLSRILATKGILILSLFIVGDTCAT